MPETYTPHIALIIGSHRPNGNSERLARLALDHLPVPATIDPIALFQHRIERFRDFRHDGSLLPTFNDDYEALLDRVLAADVLLFATPVYWYSLPGVLKDFLDRFSGTLRDPSRPDFKATMRQKVAYGVTVCSDEDRSVAAPVVESLRLTTQYYFGMVWGGAVVGYGNRPGDVLKDEQSVAQARSLLSSLPALLAKAQEG